MRDFLAQLVENMLKTTVTAGLALIGMFGGIGFVVGVVAVFTGYLWLGIFGMFLGIGLIGLLLTLIDRIGSSNWF